MATANNEFFEALSALEKERGLPEDYLIDKIKAAIVIAVKKDYEVEDDNVVVDIDPEVGAFRASLLRDIVEEVENPHTQVSLEDAQKVRKSYKVGQRMVTPLKTKEFGRIAAQTAKHVIRQGLREGERNLQCSEMQSRAHELIAATVVSIDPERGNIVLDLGKGGSAVLPRNEQVPGETFTEGQTVQVYVVDVLATDRGPRVTISRTHPGLVKRMFELEVPEIYDGTVEVKAIAREAGCLLYTSADFLRQSPQFLPGQGLICRQSRQLLLHAGNLVRRNADARQLLFRERRLFRRASQP